MMGISFWRILRAATQNFWRNFWLSVATTFIMTITLLMMLSLYFANVFGGVVLRNIEEKVDLSVTFKENVQAEYIDAIAAELTARSDVEQVKIISSDEALNMFRNRHQDDPFIEDSLRELEDNPLSASVYIIATEPRFYETIAAHLSAEKYSPFIAEVNFANSKNVIDRLISLITSIKNFGLITTGIFSLLVVLIMFNTVRLAIYSFREEIDIMRLVGASRWFVQGPFIFEAILVALLAVGFSTLIAYPTLNAVTPHLKQFFFDTQSEQFSLYQFATDNWLRIVGIQIALAVSLASFSSLIAVRRYLRD